MRSRLIVTIVWSAFTRRMEGHMERLRRLNRGLSFLFMSAVLLSLVNCGGSQSSSAVRDDPQTASVDRPKRENPFALVQTGNAAGLRAALTQDRSIVNARNENGLPL